jgi:hypothetical protein
MSAFQSAVLQGSKCATRFRLRASRLIQSVARKRIAIVRDAVWNLEMLVNERRALLEELNRNCWASSHAEAALTDAEVTLSLRRRSLDRLLQAAP